MKPKLTAQLVYCARENKTLKRYTNYDVEAVCANTVKINGKWFNIITSEGSGDFCRFRFFINKVPVLFDSTVNPITVITDYQYYLDKKLKNYISEDPIQETNKLEILKRKLKEKEAQASALMIETDKLQAEIEKEEDKLMNRNTVYRAISSSKRDKLDDLLYKLSLLLSKGKSSCWFEVRREFEYADKAIYVADEIKLDVVKDSIGLQNLIITEV